MAKKKTTSQKQNGEKWVVLLYVTPIAARRYSSRGDQEEAETVDVPGCLYISQVHGGKGIFCILIDLLGSQLKNMLHSSSTANRWPNPITRVCRKSKIPEEPLEKKKKTYTCPVYLMEKKKTA